MEYNIIKYTSDKEKERKYTLNEFIKINKGNFIYTKTEDIKSIENIIKYIFDDMSCCVDHNILLDFKIFANDKSFKRAIKNYRALCIWNRYTCST